MHLYHVYQKTFHNKSKNKAEEIILVRDGFSFFAWVFNAFWLLSKKLWVPGLCFFLIIAVLGALGQINEGFNPFLLSARILIPLYVGFAAGEFWQKGLIKDGYKKIGMTYGRDEIEAKINAISDLKLEIFKPSETFEAEICPNT